MMNNSRKPTKVKTNQLPASGKLLEQLQDQSTIFGDLMAEIAEGKVAEVHIEIRLRNGTAITYTKDVEMEEMRAIEDEAE